MTTNTSEKSLKNDIAVSSPNKKRLTFAIDFDGVIYPYKNGYNNGLMSEDPIPGARDALVHLRNEGHKIVINTCRGAVEDLKSYFNLHDIPFDEINENSDNYEDSNKGKPFADYYIDDRAIRFEGDWSLTLDEVRRKRFPWFIKSENKIAADLMNDSAELYRQRNLVYGDSYRRHGEIMAKLFPNGVTLKTAEDFNRFGILNMKISKVTRYCQNFEKGGHLDSVIDDGVYTFMLAELDMSK
ncbi:putative dehalogenase hydrolase-like protein [Rhizobium phage RHph_TM40]|nr:putative dehalogenase hydrolase-like protein [Rhizobium phage RHph_TM40]QIG77791.1 putative dehalogenase hydrolase-like protein [Rhizobium phage RHph_TM61]